MKELEECMVLIFQSGGKIQAGVPTSGLAPFAVVNSVSSGSPSDEAGFLPGDKILSWGGNSGKSEGLGLKEFSEAVRGSENV